MTKKWAPHFKLGAATLALIAVVTGGFLGYRRIHTIQQRAPLRVVFQGSAAGLARGGSVNFDGIQAGEIRSIRLVNPRKIVALVMLDKSAPIRQDTAVGIEFQGLTGVAAISLIGGAASAPPVPRDSDGIPTLTADLSETQSIRDTLHNVDHVLVDNRETIRDSLLSFETYTATLAGKGDSIESIMRKADSSFTSFDQKLTKIDAAIPDLAKGKNGELYQKLKSIRELADSFRKKSATVMEESRRTLLDVSDAANKMGRKLEPAKQP